jgi:hypothetical protein
MRLQLGTGAGVEPLCRWPVQRVTRGGRQGHPRGGSESIGENSKHCFDLSYLVILLSGCGNAAQFATLE